MPTLESLHLPATLRSLAEARQGLVLVTGPTGCGKTKDTSQAVSRLLDSFPLSNQQQIRQQLSLALPAVVAQQLVPSTGDGARYPVVEILKASSGVRSLIRKGEDHQLYSALSTGRSEGMISMEQSLAEMVRSGRIHRDTPMAHCFRPDDLLRYLQA